jgi:hypothetical protein
MKRFILLLVFSFFALISKAQLTADFPDSNFHWNEVQEYYDIDFPHRNIYYYGTIYYNGNINLANQTFKKINYKYVQTYFMYENNILVTKHSNNDVLLGYLFNDKPNKKVFFKPNNSRYFNNDTTINLLFDFNLKVGDKYPITINNTDTNARVKQIDTIIDPYGIRRAVYNMFDTIIYSHFYPPVIQGIGFCGGLLNNNLELPFEGYYSDIECFNFNNNSFNYAYQSGTAMLYSDSCSGIEFIGIAFIKSKNISITPNPVTSTFTINIPNEEAAFTLINTLGQSQEILGVREGEQWKFEVNDLPNGVYVLKVFGAEQMYFGRFFKN